MKLLLHICCAPCLCAPLEELRNNGIEITGYFYNPNIHPLLEFRRRLKSVKVFQESSPLPVHYCEDYGLEEFLRSVGHSASGGQRCKDCYHLRLTATARYARAQGLDAFSTALLFSAHQKHELLRQVGEEVSQQEGIPFYYVDYRHLYPKSHELAKKRCLYLQSYCGCIFSEYERYAPTTKYLYKGDSGGPCKLECQG